jgi:transcriptional regulator with XRE-family HTH domain
MEDKRAMNLVQTIIKAKMRQGMTQADIARECKVTEKTVWNALYGKHVPQPKLLAALRIKRDVVYTLISPKDERDLLAEPGKAMTGSARKLRKMRRAEEKQLQPAVIEIPADVPHVGAGVRSDKLTAVRAQIAIRYGLKAGPVWASFLAQLNFPFAPDLDDDWVSYCAAMGNQQPALAPKPDDGALGAPGELYAHLKPVVRGADMRPVDPFGVKFVDAK